MKAKVLKSFLDKPNNVIQAEGKIIDLTEERFKEIMSINNGLIESVEDSPDFPKHIGGGYYELSNGDKMKGKEAAIDAQADIDASNE